VVDPYDAGTVYATSTNRALFRTRDGGLTWSPIAPDLYVYELAADRAHRGVLFAAEADGLYRSDDGGDSWARAALDHLIVVGVAADPRAADTVFAVTLDGGSRVWKSTDHGTTWTSAAIFVPSRESRFVFDSVRPEILYLFFYEADLTWLLRSSDGGASRSEMSAYGFRDLAVAPDGTLLAATDYGLERSSDGGATWEPPFEPGYVPPGGPPRDALTRILVSSAPGELFAAGAAGIWRSGDNGAGWTAINQGLLAQGAYQVAVSPTGPPDVFALAGIILAGSADQGATWTRLHSVLDGPQPYRIEALDPLHPGTIYGIVHDQAEFPAVSTNGGREWSKLEIPYNCDSGDSICDVYLRTVALGPDGSLFAGGSFYIHYLGGGSFLLRSEDGGQTWESLRPVRGIFDLAVDPGRRDTYHALGCRGFFQSTDAGVTWQKAWRARVPLHHPRGDADAGDRCPESAAALHRDVRPGRLRQLRRRRDLPAHEPGSREGVGRHHPDRSGGLLEALRGRRAAGSLPVEHGAAQVDAAEPGASARAVRRKHRARSRQSVSPLRREPHRGSVPPRPRRVRSLKSTAAVPGDRELVDPPVQDGCEIIQLLFAVARGDRYPQARLAFGDDRMRNPLHVEAALLAVVREPERRPVLAADHGEDRGRVVGIRETDRPQSRREMADVLTQTSETLGLVLDYAQRFERRGG